MKTSLLALLLTFPGPSSDYFKMENADRVELRKSETAYMEVYYYNSSSRVTGLTPSDGTLELNGVTVDYHIDVNEGPETITVTPRGAYIARPEFAEVEDGAETIIEIIPLGF